LDHPEYESFLNERKQKLSEKVELLKNRVKYLDDITCAGAEGDYRTATSRRDSCDKSG